MNMYKIIVVLSFMLISCDKNTTDDGSLTFIGNWNLNKTVSIVDPIGETPADSLSYTHVIEITSDSLIYFYFDDTIAFTSSYSVQILRDYETRISGLLYYDSIDSIDDSVFELTYESLSLGNPYNQSELLVYGRVE